jgi:hypothetical protein
VKECKPANKRDTCISMFIAALFTITKLWNQTTDEHIKKIGIHPYITMNYYSAIKKNEITSFAGKHVELESIMLSKIR